MTHFNDCLGERKIMTRDLLRTVINKQKVKSNIGIKTISKAVSHRTASTNNTIKPELVFDRRRPVSQSTRYGQVIGHQYQNTHSANTTTKSGFARVSHPEQATTPWKDLKLGSTATGLPTSVQSSMKPSRTNAYPFSLLETIFTENSFKTPFQTAPTAPAIQASEPRADSAFPSMRSLATTGGRWTDTATNGLLPYPNEPNQHIVQASVGRPSLKESVYRRTHRSGGYRTEPNAFM